MSNRSMLEFNHDYAPPRNDDAELLKWAKKLLAYLGTGIPSELPRGVTFFNMRHHSQECPLGEPPRGWQNDI